jgi:hypothetical protein
VPAFAESVVEDLGIEPLLTTSMRGTFLRTRVSDEGCVRYGFSDVSLDEESVLLSEFCRVLILEGLREGWNNTVSTIEGAFKKLQQAGFVPGSLVTCADLGEKEIIPEGVKLFVSEIPVKALVAASPDKTGSYTRIGEYVSILAQRVNVTFVLVQ